MEAYPDILRQDCLERFRAKPSESIWAHTQAVLRQMTLLDELGYLDGLEPKTSLKLAILLHDIGKMGLYFQRRIDREDAYTKFDPRLETGHNVLSVCLAPPRTELAPDLREEEYSRVLFAVLYHHHYVDNFNALKYCGEEKFNSQIPERKSNNSQRLRAPFKDMTRNFDIRAVQLTGLLMRCDHAASAHVQVEYPPAFVRGALERCLENWRVQNPAADWRELQVYAAAHSGENLIIRAQTGMGKTEAALKWIGTHKAFFVLPLRTAINAIYDRICQLLPDDCPKAENVGLLHSAALSHILVQKDQKESAKTRPASKENELSELDYQKRSRSLMLPLMISTPDQLFDIVFKYYGSEAKLATLAYSRIVLDEIQAYSPELLAYIIYGLELLVSLGAHFMIMTATLPPFVQDLIDEALKSIPAAQQEAATETKNTYRTATFTDPDEQIRHRVEVFKEKINAEFIHELFQKNETRGKSNKILVICNTVKKAQTLYEQLVAMYPAHLIHAKFTQEDRGRLEIQILADGQSDCSKSVIWFATQIVEASLDIDFDYLVTELSDLPGLMQRLGRVNRKGLKSTVEVNCFIFTEIEENLLVNQQGTRGFIDPAIYALSREAIVDLRGPLTESEKNRLIDAWLTTENLKKNSGTSGYLHSYKMHRGYIKSLYIGQVNEEGLSQKFRNIETETIIPVPVYRSNEATIMQIDERMKNLNLELMRRSKQKIKLNNQSLYLEIERLKVQLRAYTLSVIPRDVHSCGPSFDLGYGEMIKVSACHYDSQKGFRRMTTAELAEAGVKVKDKHQEEMDDNPVL